MKIGIGVTSYKRPKHLDVWRNQILKYAPKEYELSVYVDEPRKGIAHGKNENIKDLRDCDYIFLFDDDCFPIKEGWTDFFIEASKESGQNHFMYLKENPTIKQLNRLFDIDLYNNCSGCMMFFTKEVVNRVGAYNPNYGIYGFEHAGYSNRIHKSGLTPLGSYSCPVGANKYIYSLDLDNHLSFNKELNHKPSIEIKEAILSIEKNKEIYLQDTEIYIPL